MANQVNYDDLELSFADEFNSPALSRWNTLPPWANTIIYSSRQHYVDIKNEPNSAVNPFSFDNGILTISVNPTPNGFDASGQPYTSGYLSTHGEFDQAYGYFEMRSQLPAGSGIWPSFWMMPSSASLPEIDIMESSGKWTDGYIANMHHLVDGKVTSHDNSIVTPDVNNVTEFHRYGVNWQPDTVQWYFDGQLVAEEPTPRDANLPMYLMVGVGVAAGGWAGSVDKTTSFPAEYRIDYVRAYTGNADAPRAIKDTPASAPSGADLSLAESKTPIKIVTGTVGNDDMDGGTGDDWYKVNSSRDVIHEAADAGIDTAMVDYGNYNLGAHVENISIIRESGAWVSGNGLDNRIKGGSGDDQIIGGGGRDVITGGDGRDVFNIDRGHDMTVVADFAPSIDRLHLRGFDFPEAGAVKAAMVQNGSSVSLNLGNGEALHLSNHQVDDINASDIVLTRLSDDQGWLI
jgi:beta-glucanase (GH16 family)